MVRHMTSPVIGQTELLLILNNTFLQKGKDMKLKVPVNSYMSAVKQIEAGADEIYMGLEDSHFNRMSYSARAQITCKGVHSNLKDEEFAKIVLYAHSKNVTVSLTANCQHVTKSKDDFYRKGFIEYVKRGIRLGADAVIVSDIGNLIAIRKCNIMIPLIAGCYLNCFNRETIDFLKNLNVFRICVPDQVTFDEMKSMKEHSDIQIEIFIGYGCSNIPGMCNFYHNSGEKNRLGVPCRANFRLDGHDPVNILDACPDCAVCSIPKLYDLGIDSLKIIGRETDCEKVAAITKMYKSAIQMYADTRSFHRKEILSAIPWWENEMCYKRCKYEETNLLRSYI